MKRLILGAIAGALLCTPALAQQAPGNVGNNAGNNFGAQNGAANGNQNGAILQLPPSVQSVVSIDAFNMLIIASDGEQPGQTRYTPTRIQHVYSGGIARLFGGSTVPTAQFVTPGNVNNNAFGNNNGGVAVNGGGNQNGFGGNQNGFGGNQNGFGGNQNGFGGNQNGGFNGGFQNGGGFGGIALRNGALIGNGFDTVGRNPIVNARVQAR